MAKGLAVVSGSQDVVFKALETGVVNLGSNKTDAVVEVSGALTLRSHTSSSLPVLSINDLAVVQTASVGNSSGILIISGSEVKQADHISSSYVLLADGRDVETAIYDISSSLNATVLTIKDDTGTGSGSVDLGTNSLIFSGTANETTVTIAPSDGSTADVTVTIGLPDDVTVTNSLTAYTVTASNGLVVSNGGATITGDISGSGTLTIAGVTDLNSTLAVASTVTVESGGLVVQGGGAQVTGNISGSADLSLVGSASIGGDLTVDGDLLVKGSVTTINTTNLTVEDAIILVGSGSSGSVGELGIVFGSTDGRSLSLQDGVFYLGSTSDDTLDGNIDPNNDGLGKLILGSLTASVEIKAGTIESVGNLVVGGTSSLNGPVVLGDAAADSVTVNGYLTSSTGIVVSSSLIVGDAGSVNTQYTQFVTQVRMPIFTVAGVNAVAGFPEIPAAYISSPAAQGGHMFYLTASTNVGPGELFPEANKWYMNERGVWHESFFFTE